MTPSAPRVVLAAALLGSMLAACPIPQSLPEYPKGVAIAPPRILVGSASYATSGIVRVPAGCTVAPTYDLRATLVATDRSLPVDARWFVDYDPLVASLSNPAHSEQPILAGSDPNDYTRPVTPWAFHPYDYPSVQLAAAGPPWSAAGIVHVVDLVVANQFDDQLGSQPDQLPNRTPAIDQETQFFRWTFLLVNDPAAVPCP